MSQTNPDLLPEELLWSASGHASDVALTAIADGEALLQGRQSHERVRASR